MKNNLTKGLAIVGTVLVWLPVLAPFVFSLLGFFRRGFFNFDYLMPAEFFLVFLVGGGLLLWAALRARSHREVIGGGLGAAVIFLAASMVLASATGLASGAVEPGGWQFILVIGLIAAYSLAVVVTGVAGVRLVRDLSRPQAPAVNPA